MAKGFNWKGKQVAQRVRQASADGINETLALCVHHGKDNHPGWNNQTGNAEGSIRVVDVAEAATLIGRWGSVGVVYFRRLELLHGRALLSTADVLYGELAGNIRRRLA